MSTNFDQQGAGRRQHGARAVVIGASMGGLLAARVLSDAYEHVLLVERDVLPDAAESRRGVPQGRHGHALLPRGLAVIEELFPGFTREVTALGAPLFTSRAVRVELNDHELVRADTGGAFLSTSRPFLEGHVRRRVAALPNVSIMDGCDVAGPVTDDGGRRITGVRVVRRADDAALTLESDLVVDATGRAGRALRWLDDLGFERPPVAELHVGITYATRRVQSPRADLGADRIVVIGPDPERMAGVYLAEQEHGWWIVTLFGYGDSAPPSDPDGFARFTKAVAPPDVAAALERATPISEIVMHRLPSSLRRRYELLRRFPEGLLVFGDAICSFNPIYGQGQTTAALQALALRRELRRRRFDALRFFRAAARPVGDAWDLATGSDLALPAVAGPRPLKVRLLNAYVERVLGLAEQDETVSAGFQRVVSMLDRPPALLRPAIAARVARAAISRAGGAERAVRPAVELPSA